VIDGVIHDTHDPGRDGTRAVYGYWRAPAPKATEVRPSAIDTTPQLRHTVPMPKPTPKPPGPKPPLPKPPPLPPPRKETRMHKTTLTLDDRMWREAKIRAMDEGKSLQKILEAALDAYLKSQKKEPKR
jgi:hypothetical protein